MKSDVGPNILGGIFVVVWIPHLGDTLPCTVGPLVFETEHGFAPLLHDAPRDTVIVGPLPSLDVGLLRHSGATMRWTVRSRHKAA